MFSGMAFAQFSGGNGSAATPYQVANVTDLDNIRNYLSAYFIQTADIDLAGNPDWQPIAGGGTATLFTGNYNGNGKIISNLTITRPATANVGLFGHLGQGTATDAAVIRNVHLVNVNVSGARGTGSLVGRVTGNIYTLIEACSATGETGKRSVTGDAATGGLVGSNNSVSETPGGANNPIISECYADIDVFYSGVEAISPNGAEKFGGLAGCSQKGTILDSYARGSVTAIKNGAWAVYNVGGLAGCIIYRGVVERSYSTGIVSGAGATNIGGLVGNNIVSGVGNVGTSVNSYWDTETSYQSNSAVGTGYTTVQMKMQSQLTGFDFTNIWQISAGVNDGYPTLRSVPSTTYLTWTGISSADWTTAANWNLNRIPANHDIAVIPGGCSLYPVISAVLSTDVLPKGLSIRTGGTLTIQPGGSMSIPSIFLNNEGITGLVINSDASGSGSLIHNSGNLNTTVSRYISAASWATAGNGWHLLSSPVANQAIEGTWTPSGPGNDYDFYAFNETATTEYWLNQKVEANHLTAFVPGKGYLVAYQQTGTKTFAGNLNVADLTISGLTSTIGSAYPGWHLVGNPFASAINWSTGTWTKTNINDIAQVWNSADASYKTSTEVSGVIPSMNGFMVHTSGSGSITIPADARVHGTANWYKSDEEFILLKVNDLEGHTSQSSIVRFNPSSTEAYDHQFDSYFLAGFAPMFFSVSGSDLYALNTLPAMSNNLVIPFGFVKNASANYSLGLAKNIPGAIVYLTDKKTSTVTNLCQNPVYNFTASQGDDVNRFTLHFSTVGINNPTAGETVQVYANNGLVYLNGVAAGAEVTISDITGRVVRQVHTCGDSLTTLNVSNVPHGIYIVTMNTGKELLSHKIVL
jgi:hypothetical protein